jgi:hypothetical protein
MSQHPGSYCPTCRTQLTPEQRFCANCGTVIDSGAHQSTARPPSMEGWASAHNDGAVPATPPPPPPSSFPPQSSSYYAGPPVKDSSKSVMRQIGCGLLSVILVVLLLCGGAGYLGYNWLRGLANSPSSGNTGSTQGSNSGNAVDSTPAPASIKTTSLSGSRPLAFIYSDVKITLLDAKQSASFSDGITPPKPGVVRIGFKEEQDGTNAAYYSYSDVMRLILPDGTIVAPITAKNGTVTDASTNRQNWIDFPASTDLSVANMVLKVGTDAEAQMQIPLKANADVSKYQPKTVTLNKQTTYTGLSWTLTSASVRWSANGKHAEKGMIYVITSLKVDNTSAQDFYGSPGDYLRLKTGDVTSAPTGDITIPVAIEKGKTGATGECAFLVPQGSTDFSLIFLATPAISGSQQTSIPFQVQ